MQRLLLRVTDVDLTAVNMPVTRTSAGLVRAQGVEMQHRGLIVTKAATAAAAGVAALAWNQRVLKKSQMVAVASMLVVVGPRKSASGCSAAPGQVWPPAAIS